MKKILLFSSLSAIILGLLLVIGGIGGLVFTYKNVVRENITTSKDANIANVPVRGPFTIKAQADTIREHVLRITEGKTFSEMPQQIPKLDENNEPVLDKDDKNVMTENTTRNIWITATTLMTALNLGMLAYAFFSLTLLFGLFSVWIGIIFFILSQKIVKSLFGKIKFL